MTQYLTILILLLIEYYCGIGMHVTTRYGEHDIPEPLGSDASAAEIEARRKSLGVLFRNWHPGNFI